jgi:hypothetical protein
LFDDAARDRSGYGDFMVAAARDAIDVADGPLTDLREIW